MIPNLAHFLARFPKLGLSRPSAAKKAAYEDVPSNFRAVEPHPHTRSLHPGLGGADYYSRKQLKHARNAVLSAELLVFAFVLALVLRALGW